MTWMTIPRAILAVLVATSLVGRASGSRYQAESFVLVIIDGARYSETFGDPDHLYVPKMYEMSLDLMPASVLLSASSKVALTCFAAGPEAAAATEGCRPEAAETAPADEH